MGNQSTSGIVEERAKNEAPENSYEFSSPDELKEEIKTTNDLQEKAEKADLQEAEVEESVKDVSEELKGSDNEECETQKDVKPNESNLEDQLCAIKGEMQNPNPKSAAFTNLNCTPLEAVGTTLDLQQDQTMLVKEIDDQVVEKKETNLVVADTASVESPLIDKDCTPREAIDLTSELQEDQIMLVKEIDDQVVEKKEDDLVMADTDSVEGPLLETCVDKEELGKNNDLPEDEQSNSLNDLQNICLLDSSAEENEKQDEFLAPAQEKLRKNEILNNDDDNTTQPSDQEIKQFLISCSEAPKEMIKEIGEERAVEIDCVEKVDSLDEIKIASERDEKGLNANEVNKNWPIQKEGPKAESILEDSESKAHGSTEKHGFESNSRYIGDQVELRKSPSFDFGVSFNARLEESDQTPLLYQNRTPMRSFSTCSNLRFQNRSVQTEYIGKSLQYEVVDMEEKTIRMERSSSERSVLNKEGKANVITKGEQENSGCDKKQENGLMASPLKDNGGVVSPGGSGKRKPRSSLFTTCICCTAAIS